MPRQGLDRKRLCGRVLTLSGLSAVAISAPLLEMYGKNPEAFVANRSSPLQIALFGVLGVVLIPLVCLALLAVAEMIGPRTSTWTFYLLFGALAIATGLVVGRQIVPDTDVGSWLITAGVVGALTALHRRLRRGLRFFALALPVILVLFLFTSATASLIWAHPADASETGPVKNPKSILFIQLDELPTASLMSGEDINAELFPNFARLAKDGTWYRNAFSPSIATTQSVPAALTGKIWDDDLSPTAADHPNSLFTLLADSHDMHVIEWVAELCPEQICPDYAGRSPAQFSSLLTDAGIVYGHLSLPPGLRTRLPAVDNTWKGFVGQDDDALDGAPVEVSDHPVPAPGSRASWVNWMQRITNGIAANEPPTLHYTHLKAPHVKWQINPSGTHYIPPEDHGEVDGVERLGYWVDEQERATLGLQRHLFQLGFVDAMIGSALRRLDETGNWNDTMIIVLADHGASFEAGQHRRWPYQANRDDLYRVPLFIKYPGQETGATVDDPAFITDVLPTIVDVLEISTDWQLDGTSLLEIDGLDRPHEVIGWCCNRSPVSTDLQILFDQVERNHRWLPNQTSWSGVVAAGPYAGLVGTSIDDIGIEISRGLRWALAEQSGLIDDEHVPGMAQTVLSGRIEIPAEAVGDELLVAVNGTVAGTGFVIRETSQSGEWRAIVSEEFLLGADNEVTILIPGANGSWLRGSTDHLEVEYLDGQGRPLVLAEQGTRRLKVDRIQSTSSGWTITGWSADVGAKKTPDELFVYAAGHLVASGPPSIDNQNVVRWTGSNDLLRSGFEFRLDRKDLPADLERIAVVARFGETAVVETISLR